MESLSLASPRQHRSSRAQSTLAGAKSSVTASQAEDSKMPVGKPSAEMSALRPTTHQHRPSKSVHHHHSHHHLHLHGSHGSGRARSQTTSGKAPAITDSYLSPDSAMDKLKKVGSRIKENTAPTKLPDVVSRTSDGNRTTQDARALQLMRRLPPRDRKNKQRADARESEIRRIYQKVSDVSMDNIQKLDGVYYSILERLSALQSMISSLQELAVQTKDLRTTFDNDAKHVESYTQGQIQSFGSFQKQKERIAQLEARIKDGKSRTERLTERLELARERVNILETKEAQVQASISFQFRIVWFVLGGIATIIAAILLAHYFLPTPQRDLLDGPAPNQASIPFSQSGRTKESTEVTPSEAYANTNLISSLSSWVSQQIPDVVIHSTSEMQETIESSSKPSPTLSSVSAFFSAASSSSALMEEDPRMRLFEEL